MLDPMLLRVLEAPEDEDLRQVWADALQEQGDPRGEIIALQLAAAGGPLSAVQEKRARSLIAKHATAWLGPLAGVVMRKAGLVFDRGLVRSCQIQIKRLPVLESVIGHPLWSTVEDIWFCDHFAVDPRIVPLLVHPVFRSLRRVVCVGANNVFAALAANERPLPFTSIETIGDAWRSNSRAAFEGDAREAAALPALRRLGFGVAIDRAADVFELPVVQRLEELVLTVDDPLGDWMSRAEALRHVTTLELRPDAVPLHGTYRLHLALRFQRGVNGRWSRLEIRVNGFVGAFAARLAVPQGVEDREEGRARRRARFTRGLAPYLAMLDENSLERIDVAVEDDPTVRAALGRFRRAELRFSSPDV